VSAVKLHRGAERRRSGTFLAEGENAVVEAVAAGLDPRPSFADGLHVQEVLDAVARSSDADGVWTGVESPSVVASAERVLAAS